MFTEQKYLCFRNNKLLIISFRFYSCLECQVSGIDMAFVMDGSGSVGRNNFETAKTFVQEVVKGFVIGPDNSRVAVIQYSSNPVVEFTFTEHTTDTALESAIRAIRYVRSSKAYSQN